MFVSKFDTNIFALSNLMFHQGESLPISWPMDRVMVALLEVLTLKI